MSNNYWRYFWFRFCFQRGVCFLTNIFLNRFEPISFVFNRLYVCLNRLWWNNTSFFTTLHWFFGFDDCGVYVKIWEYSTTCTEMYKVTKGLAPTAISSLLMQFCKNRHTQSQADFSVSQVNTICFGQNSIRYLGPLIRNSIPTALRNV